MTGHDRSGPSVPPRAATSRSAGGVLALALGIAACGGDAGDAPGTGAPTDEPVAEAVAPAEAASAAGAASEDAGVGEGYVSIEVASGGEIAGTVRYSGAVPDPREFAMEGDAAACGDPKRIPAIESGPAGGLSNAVVTLTGIRQGAPPVPGPEPTLDQRGCEFRPHVLLAHVGDTVRVLNGDPLTHNVHTAAFDNRSVNRTQPSGADAILLSFSAPERVRVQCDIHPWMSAWIIVTEHPYAAVTDESGRFVLGRVPPGDHTLEVWHEALGAVTRPVTVEPGRTSAVVIEMTGRGP